MRAHHDNAQLLIHINSRDLAGVGQNILVRQKTQRQRLWIIPQTHRGDNFLTVQKNGQRLFRYHRQLNRLAAGITPLHGSRQAGLVWLRQNWQRQIRQGQRWQGLFFHGCILRLLPAFFQVKTGPASCVHCLCGLAGLDCPVPDTIHIPIGEPGICRFILPPPAMTMLPKGWPG